MQRLVVVIVTLTILVGTLAALPAAGTTGATSSTTGSMLTADVAEQNDGADGNASTVAPGERLAGVIGVREAELDGEMERRTAGIEIARTASPNASAAVLDDRFDALRQRLQELEQRKRTLERARETGAMTRGRYESEIASLVAKTETLSRLTNETEAHVRGLPRDVRERHGINVTAIRTLHRDAANLSGPEVAAIARSIAGPGVGEPVGDHPDRAEGPPNDRGTGEDRDDATRADGASNQPKDDPGNEGSRRTPERSD